MKYCKDVEINDWTLIFKRDVNLEFSEIIIVD